MATPPPPATRHASPAITEQRSWSPVAAAYAGPPTKEPDKSEPDKPQPDKSEPRYSEPAPRKPEQAAPANALPDRQSSPLDLPLNKAVEPQNAPSLNRSEPPVPVGVIAALADDVRPDSEQEQLRPDLPSWEGLAHWLDRLLLPIALVLSLTLLMIWQLNRALPALPAPLPEQAALSAQNRATSPADSREVVATQAPSLPDAEVADHVPASDISRRAVFWTLVLLVFALLLVLTSLTLLAFSRSEVRDEPLFVKAIAIWSEALQARNATPRHYKRVLNQLRLLAMRARAETLRHEPAQAVRLVVLRALPEIGVVDVAGIVACGRFLASAETLTEGALTARLTPAQLLLLQTALKRHQQLQAECAEQRLWPDEADLTLNGRLLQGLRLN